MGSGSLPSDTHASTCAGEAVCRHLAAVTEQYPKIAFFVSMKSEVNVVPLLRECLRQGTSILFYLVHSMSMTMPLPPSYITRSTWTSALTFCGWLFLMRAQALRIALSPSSRTPHLGSCLSCEAAPPGRGAPPKASPMALRLIYPTFSTRPFTTRRSVHGETDLDSWPLDRWGIRNPPLDSLAHRTDGASPSPCTTTCTTMHAPTSPATCAMAQLKAGLSCGVTSDVRSGTALNAGVDAVLVPGAAFDKKGGRLGRGKGYALLDSGRLSLVQYSYQPCSVNAWMHAPVDL